MSSSGRPLLLIVDDEPDVLSSLCSLAARELPDVEVQAASSGEQACAAMARRAPTAILCDYRMPDLDGIEVLRRSVAFAPAARRALMTAFADSSLPARASRGAPIDVFLEKATDADTWRRQLAALMRPSASAPPA